jgi:hypothetical protein
MDFHVRITVAHLSRLLIEATPVIVIDHKPVQARLKRARLSLEGQELDKVGWNWRHTTSSVCPATAAAGAGHHSH